VTAGDIDWRYLAKDTFVPGITAVVSVLFLLASHWYHDAQALQFRDIRSSYGAVQSDYDQLIVRKRIIDRYHRRYEQFHELGFVGRENRLDWIESLRVAAGQLQLQHASYAIEPQLDVVAPVQGSVGGKSIEIHVSQLELELGLLHELDLLRFFDRLQSEAPGLIKVDNCRLTRQNATTSFAVAEANIVASCSVAIFSAITSDVLARAPRQ
jgi:hypothetical protein